MRTVFALVLLAAFAVAEENPTLTHANTACGPFDVHFDAQASTSHSIAQPESGKGLVYVAEDFRKAPGELGNPTIRRC